MFFKSNTSKRQKRYVADERHLLSDVESATANYLETRILSPELVELEIKCLKEKLKCMSEWSGGWREGGVGK